jgi:hypothetical protein
VRRANASFLAQSGRLEGLHDLRSGITVEVQPYVSGIVEGERNEAGDLEHGTFEPDAGVNLRLSRTNLALDATLNPDFSQVLPDFGLVTVNERFALFIPERREFFLEGIDLFNTPNQLIYTRQVVDPVAGAKFTGKFGRFGVAYLGALDESGDPDALFNIGRFRYDLAGNSLAGLTVTDRESGDDFNRVIAADTRIVFGRIYFAQAQLGQSWSPGKEGPIWQAEVDRTGRKWGYNAQLVGIAPGFETDAGFVNRTDIITARFFNRFSWYGARGRLVEQFSVFIAPRRLWEYEQRYGDGGPIEGADRVSADVRLRGNWNLSTALTRNFFWFDPAVYEDLVVGDPAGPAFTPAQKADGLFGGSVTITTPPWRKVDATMQVNYGEVPIFDEAGTGSELRVTGGIGLRPTASLRVSLNATATRIERSLGGEFRAHVSAARHRRVPAGAAVVLPCLRRISRRPARDPRRPGDRHAALPRWGAGRRPRLPGHPHRLPRAVSPVPGHRGVHRVCHEFRQPVHGPRVGPDTESGSLLRKGGVPVPALAAAGRPGGLCVS